MWLTNDIAAYRIAELHAQAADARRARAAREAARSARRAASTHRTRLTPRARLSARLVGTGEGHEVWCRHAASHAVRGLA